MTGASENGFIGVAASFTATVNDFCSIFSKLKVFLYFVRLYYVLVLRHRKAKKALPS